MDLLNIELTSNLISNEYDNATVSLLHARQDFSTKISKKKILQESIHSIEAITEVYISHKYPRIDKLFHIIQIHIKLSIK